ncbi:MAG: hypothetical protein ACP5E4_00205, partial [Candidatus Aenigmatarchaeota archaeon]
MMMAGANFSRTIKTGGYRISPRRGGKLKGTEESMSQIVFFIGAVAAAFFLIFIAMQYLPGNFGEGE